MANYNGVTSIADGIREGLITYQTMSNLKQQKQQADQLMKIQMAEKGLIQQANPFSGQDEVIKDPEAIKREKQKEYLGYREKGLIPVEDPDTHDIIDVKPDKEYLSAKFDADPYASALKGLTLQEKSAEVKRKAADPFSAMSEAEQVVAKDSAKKLSDTQTIKDSMDEVIKILNDPKVSAEQKMVAAQGSLKLVNSASLNSPDVVGTEEAKRAGALLNPSMMNALPGRQGAVLMPDVKAFTQQLENISNSMQNRAGLLGKRAGLPASSGLIKDNKKIAKKKVSNGKETLMIDSSDLEHAIKDGYKEVD